MNDDLDAAFDEWYPGSRSKRKGADEIVEQRKAAQAEIDNWDSTPVMKNVAGRPTEMFTAGDLGRALGGFSVVSVRLWERKGYIPRAPYRMPDITTEGGDVQRGRRYYSRAVIEASVEEFRKRGLIGKKRIEWKHHEDLPIALVARWREATGTKHI
jgi:hypothetical protein